MREIARNLFALKEGEEMPYLEEHGFLGVMNFHLQGLSRTVFTFEDTTPKASPRPRATWKGPFLHNKRWLLKEVMKFIGIRVDEKYHAYKLDMARKLRHYIEENGIKIDNVYALFVASGYRYPKDKITRKSMKNALGEKFEMDLVEDYPTSSGRGDVDNLFKTIMDMLMREEDEYNPIMNHDDSRVPMGATMKVRGLRNFVYIEIYHSDDADRRILSEI